MAKRLYEIRTVDGLRAISADRIPSAFNFGIGLISADFGVNDTWMVPITAVARFAEVAAVDKKTTAAQWAEEQGWPEFQRSSPPQTEQ